MRAEIYGKGNKYPETYRKPSTCIIMKDFVFAL